MIKYIGSGCAWGSNKFIKLFLLRWAFCWKGYLLGFIYSKGWSCSCSWVALGVRLGKLRLRLLKGLLVWILIHLAHWLAVRLAIRLVGLSIGLSIRLPIWLIHGLSIRKLPTIAWLLGGLWVIKLVKLWELGTRLNLRIWKALIWTRLVCYNRLACRCRLHSLRLYLWGLFLWSLNSIENIDINYTFISTICRLFSIAILSRTRRIWLYILSLLTRFLQFFCNLLERLFICVTSLVLASCSCDIWHH